LKQDSVGLEAVHEDVALKGVPIQLACAANIDVNLKYLARECFGVSCNGAIFLLQVGVDVLRERLAVNDNSDLDVWENIDDGHV
jgi:hypothetical protein